MTNDEGENGFWRRLEAYEREGLEAYVKATGRDVRDAVQELIAHRERLRDEELARLEEETAKLLRLLRENDLEKLAAELRCFKEVLALHAKS